MIVEVLLWNTLYIKCGKNNYNVKEFIFHGLMDNTLNFCLDHGQPIMVVKYNFNENLNWIIVQSLFCIPIHELKHLSNKTVGHKL